MIETPSLAGSLFEGCKLGSHVPPVRTTDTTKQWVFAPGSVHVVYMMQAGQEASCAQ